MTILITLDDAAAHLNLDDDCEDHAVVDACVKAASAAVLAYIGDNAYVNEEKTEVRPDVQSAVKLLVGDFYRYRESESPDRIDSRFGYGYLPQYVTALLFPYRRLVIA
ncbi:MAG: phage gp6-like head-tail connector protein [Gammaproteobacteria bacterium]|nr:phage gp6-like head-tail connector protein [Gammaproteobacteria bacterium]